jgi:hypothetical protein
MSCDITKLVPGDVVCFDYVFDLKVNKEKCFWISENIAYSFEAI